MDNGRTPQSHGSPSTGPSPLLRNLLLFGRLLRAIGLPITSGRLIEVADSLAFIDIGSKTDFKNAARCLLVSRHEDIELFDLAFEIFWRSWSGSRRGDPLQKLMEDVIRQAPKSRQPSLKGLRTRSSEARRATRPKLAPGAAGKEEPEGEKGDQSIIAIYSPGEALRAKDFSTLTQEELADAKRFIAEMRWAVTRRRSLRTRPARSGRKLDVRRSVRRNLRHGGELLDLAYRGRKMKRRQLVLLCDISGSMDRYTRLLLHFLHSVESSLQRVEVFVFGTRLTRITRALRKRDPDAAIAAVASQVQDWAGGTRIGESLRTFNQVWARRILGHGAIVMIISDGWDRGDPEELAAEMGRLQRSSYRLLWLNPLLGSANYRPLTQGIQAALPYVDDFLPVHNLATLEALALLLNEVQEGRPSRKQVRSTRGP
jgi:uncharacterized protein with von Willebrand factor type A (vWA) domain